MKKFLCIFTLTFTLGFGAAWYWTANDYIKFADPDYGVWMAKKLMLDDCNLGTVTVVGDSQAETSIVPQKVGPQVVNFGLPGASVITMLDVARRIAACPDPPKAVVISLDFQRFMGTDMFWDREIKYGLFDMDLEQIRQRARATGDTVIYDPPSPFDFDARLKDWLFKAKFPSYYFSSLLAGYGGFREDVNMGFLHDTLKDKGYHFMGEALGDNRLRTLAYRKSFASSDLFEMYFAEMLDLFAAHGIPVYFIGGPSKTKAIQVMSPEFKAGYSDYIRHWETLYPNFHILGDILPSLPPEDFSDTSHLNVIGAVVWSTHIAALLNEAGVDTGTGFSFY